MITERPRSGGFVVSLLALVFLVVVAAGVASYAMGWLTVVQQPKRTTIEINTQEIQDAAREAQQEGVKLLDHTGESLKQSGESLEDAAKLNEASSHE